MTTLNLHLLSIALTSALITIGCADKKSAVSATGGSEDQSTRTSSPADRSGGPTPADSLFFTLERTPCFGKCKAYRINVYRSGYATFEGRVNVEQEGMNNGWIGKDTLEILLKEAERIEFFGLNDSYDSPATDLPSSIIRVVANGKNKRVVGRVGTPAAFTQFFSKAETLLYPVAWKPMPKSE
jgi:hypothetical protein